jgi:hypothetical protein
MKTDHEARMVAGTRENHVSSAQAGRPEGAALALLPQIRCGTLNATTVDGRRAPRVAIFRGLGLTDG